MNEEKPQLSVVEDDETPKPKTPRTDTEILTALKSDIPEQRKLGLEALFPITKGAVLINATKDGNQITATDKLEAPVMFGAVLYIAMQLGKFLGMELNWMGHPGAPGQEPGIEVVPEGALPK